MQPGFSVCIADHVRDFTGRTGVRAAAKGFEMETAAERTSDALFFDDLIRSYVDDNPRFGERPWLERQMRDKLDAPNCRFRLLTAEPGAGKTGLIAWLSRQHPDWPRYFVCRDSKMPLMICHP